MLARRTSLVVLAMLSLMGAGCSTVHPEGTTASILSGEVFSGSKLNDPGPVDYTALEKREARPPVRWKMEF